MNRLASIGTALVLASLLIVSLALRTNLARPIPAGPTTRPAAVTGSTSSASIATPTPEAVGATPVRVAIPGSAWALAYDSARDLVWMTYAPSPDQNILAAMDPATRALTTWSIPVTGYQGVTTRLVVGPDGAIWVAENYTLVRLDPTLKSVTSVSLPVDDPDALPGMTDPSNPSAGTGISGIAPTADGGIIVARFGVAALTILDSSLAVASRMPLPASVAGATSLVPRPDGSLDLFTGRFSLGRLTVLAADGSVIGQASVPGTGVVATAQGSLVASGSAETGALLSASTAAVTAAAPATRAGPMAIAMADPRGGLDLYDDGAGALVRVVNGAVTNTVSLPLGPSRPFTGPMPYEAAHASDAPSVLVPVAQPMEAIALTVDRHGTTWCALANGAGILGVTL